MYGPILPIMALQAGFRGESDRNTAGLPRCVGGKAMIRKQKGPGASPGQDQGRMGMRQKRSKPNYTRGVRAQAIPTLYLRRLA